MSCSPLFRDRPGPLGFEARPLDTDHRGALGRHLLSLSADDRHARFGATLTDQALLDWVARIGWATEVWWGLWSRSGLQGSLQLAPTSQPGVRELAVTVCEPLRGLGLGQWLLRQALAGTPGVQRLVCHHEHPAVMAWLRRLSPG